MNEIKQIHLGRQSFTISVEAYKQLHDYLDAIKAEVGDNAADVVDEVEMRMAELLTERGTAGDTVVLPQDVNFLKEQLGEPRDFGDDEDKKVAASKPAESGSSKRLFRDPEHGMIAGVAAGVASYLNIDVLIVRLIFVVLVILSAGVGVIIYLLLWLLVPPVKSSSDRLQMNGKAVTVRNIKEAIAQADVTGAASRVSDKITKGGFWLAKVVLGIVGIALVIAGIAIAFAGTMAVSFALIHGLQAGGKTIFPVGVNERLVALSGFVVVLVIAAIIILAGRAIFRRKWAVPGWTLAGLIALFIAAASLGTAAGFTVAPNIRERFSAQEHGKWQAVPAFTQAEVDSSGNVNYDFVSDSHYGVEIRTLGSINTRAITSSVVNGKLTVDATKFQSSPPSCFIICPYGRTNVLVEVHAPSLFMGPTVWNDAGGIKIDVPPYAP